MESWLPQDALASGAMANIFVKWRENHGVRGALSLLGYELQDVVSKPMIYNCALAIAMHDRETRKDLRASGYFKT